MRTMLQDRYLLLAKRYFDDDEHQIDDDAEVSIAENGAWVSAWVWVEEAD